MTMFLKVNDSLRKQLSFIIDSFHLATQVYPKGCLHKDITLIF